MSKVWYFPLHGSLKCNQNHVCLDPERSAASHCMGSLSVAFEVFVLQGRPLLPFSAMDL